MSTNIGTQYNGKRDVGRCPICHDSDDVVQTGIEPSEIGLDVCMRCTWCGGEWTDVYSYVGYIPTNL